MDDSNEEFLAIIEDLSDLISTLPAQRALDGFDQTTLQVFWRKWPQVSAWAGWLWSQLSAELAMASQQADPEFDEIGESG